VLFAGWLQDRFGPMWLALTGAVLANLGIFLCGFTTSLHYLYFCFGMAGVGNGFGYAIVVPVMAKWFPDKRGLALGLAIAGYASSSAIFGPIANLIMFPRFGWRMSCMILGCGFLLMTVAGACMMRNPPPAHELQRPVRAVKTSRSAAHLHATSHNFTPSEVLRTPSFYFVWFGFGLGSCAGLLVVSQLIPFARSQGVPSTTLATMGLVAGALGNALGRILSGWLSDALGRLTTLRIFLAIAAVSMPALYKVGTHVAALYVMVFVVYFCYGAQASVNPAMVSDFWGTRHAGANYSLLFTAWGFAGILGPTIGGVLFDRYKNYESAFYIAGALAAVALLCELAARHPHLTMAESQI